MVGLVEEDHGRPLKGVKILDWKNTQKYVVWYQLRSFASGK